MAISAALGDGGVAIAGAAGSTGRLDSMEIGFAGAAATLRSGAVKEGTGAGATGADAAADAEAAEAADAGAGAGAAAGATLGPATGAGATLGLGAAGASARAPPLAGLRWLACFKR